MPEELGKIEKPSVEEFKKGRKLYFVPLIYRGQESSDEYIEKLNRYWNQVEDKTSALELSLGKVSKIYHEMVPSGGEEGVKVVQQLNEKSYEIVSNRLDKGAQLEATESMKDMVIIPWATVCGIPNGWAVSTQLGSQWTGL